MSRKPEKLIEPINADFDEVARTMASPKKPEITESRKPEKKRVQKKFDFPPSPFAKDEYIGVQTLKPFINNYSWEKPSNFTSQVHN